jgi:molybdopterin converting factor small subunit
MKQSDFSVELRLFGAFRKYEGTAPVLTLEVPQGASVVTLKQILGKTLRQKFENFDEDVLISESAIADEHRILLDDEVLAPSSRLAILPPVCGG